MSSPRDGDHGNTPCRLHRRDLRYQNRGNLHKLSRLFSPLLHKISTPAVDGARKHYAASGLQSVDSRENSMDKEGSSSRDGSSYAGNASAEICQKLEKISAALTTPSCSSRICSTWRCNEAYRLSVSEAQNQDLDIVMELRELLDADEEPFVLQESIREKRHPVRSKSSRDLMKMMRTQHDPLVEIVHGRSKTKESVERCHGLLACGEVSESVSDGHACSSRRMARDCVDGQIKSTDMADEGSVKVRIDDVAGGESGESSPIPGNIRFCEEERKDYRGSCHRLLDLSVELDQSSLLQQSSPVSVLDKVCLDEEEEDRSSSGYAKDTLCAAVCYLPVDRHTSISGASKLIRPGLNQDDHRSGDGVISSLIERFKEGRSQALVVSNICLGQEKNTASLAYQNQTKKHLQWLHVPDEILQELGRPAIFSFVTLLDGMISPSLRARNLGNPEAFGRDDGGYGATHEAVGREVERSLLKMLLHELIAELIQ